MTVTPIEYLESAGLQYIDTGIFASPHHSLEVSFMVSQLTTNWDTVFGARNSAYSRYTARFANAVDGVLGLQYSNSGTGKSTNYNSTYAKAHFSDDFHVIKVEKNLWYINGVLENSFNAPSNNTKYPYSLYLFALNNAGAPGDYAYIRIAYCKIWDGDNLVRDFIPALDDGNIPCLYDKVSETCFYNQGSDNFITPPVHMSEGAAIFVFDGVQAVTYATESSIWWTETVPEGTSLKVSARIGDGEFIECANGSVIPCISIGDNLSSKALEIKVEMSTEDVAVTPTMTDMLIVIGDSGDSRVLVLAFPSDRINSLRNAVGDIDISYGGGTLRGVGGAVAPFDISFTPEGLAPKNNPHDAEHIDLEVEATIKLLPIQYLSGNKFEHVEVGVQANASLTAIDDI